MVRSRASVRVVEHASVRAVLLPACNSPSVSLWTRTPYACHSSNVHQTVRCAHLAGSGHVLRRDGEVSELPPAALSAHYIRRYAHGSPCLLVRAWRVPARSLRRLREAIECLKRALIGADPQETAIHQKLAKLYNDLEEYAEAAAYHRRIVEVCRAARRSPSLPFTLLPYPPSPSSPSTSSPSSCGFAPHTQRIPRVLRFLPPYQHIAFTILVPRASGPSTN